MPPISHLWSLRIVLLFLLSITFGGTQAQTAIHFRHLTTANGLPESTGQALAEDSLGFVWIGTQSGLVRYDGTGMTIYKADVSDSTALPNNQVEGLFVDSRNRLWITTRGGLCYFQPESGNFKRVVITNDMCQAETCNWFQPAIFEDSKGNIWTYNFRGALQISPDGKRFYIPFPNPDRQAVSAVEYNSQILFSQGPYIYTYNHQLTAIDSIPSGIIELVLRNETLFATSYNGLWQKTSNGWECDASTVGLIVLGYYLDSKGNSWCTTDRCIIMRRPDGSREILTHDPNNPVSLSQYLSLSFLEDSRGWIWIGTGDGINIYNPSTPRIVHAQFLTNWNLPREPVEVITLDHHQRLWIAVAKQLVCVTPDFTSEYPYENGTAKVYNQSWFEEGSTLNFDILYAERDTLWIGTYSGNLYKFNMAKESISLEGHVETLDRLRGITRTKNGLLLGFGMGTRLYRNGNFYACPPELKNPQVVQIAAVDTNALWIGTPDHLVYQNAEEISFFPAGTSPLQPDGTMLTAALKDGDTTWLATFGAGLLAYANDTFYTYNHLNGFPDDNIWSVYRVENSIWCSTDKGIVSLNLKSGQATLLSKAQGLYTPDFLMSAHAKTEDGTLFYGHPDGLTILYPSEYAYSQATPSLSSIDVNYEASPHTYADYLTTGTITLLPGDKSITLDISFGDFEANPMLHAHWKWSDESTWIEFGPNQNQLSFSNLSAGEHTLQLSTGDGQISSVHVLVIPPFYKTTWFKLTAIFALLLATALLALWYNRWKYLKRIRVLETEHKIQAERERISKDLHDYVGAHLTRITTDLDLHILQRPDLPEDQRESLQSTRDFTKSTVHLLRDTIWAINEDTFTLDEFAERIRSFLESYLGDFVNWSVSTSGTVQAYLGPNDALNLLRIIQEATQNMLKYSDAENFTIQIESTPKNIVFQISDDGMGMHEIRSSKTSFGLNNMVERAESIGGVCDISSSLGKGVQICVTLPQKQADHLQ